MSEAEVRGTGVSAWKKTACILCSENCGLEVKTEGRELVSIRGDKDHPESRGYLCQKAARLNYYQNHADRLTTPLARMPDGSLQPVSWDQAIGDIAKRLLQIRGKHSGKAVAYYGGGGQGNHLGGVYSSSLLKAIGTPYIYTALAQEKTGDFWVNGKLFGKQTCHVTVDVENSDCVVFIGTNPWQAHGISRARKVLKELRADPNRLMIVVDPRQTETARMADIHLQLRPGTDAFLLSAILAILVAEGLIDEPFLASRTQGSIQVIEQLRKVPIVDFIEETGLQSEQVYRVARAIAKAKSSAIRADLGIQQSTNSTLNSYLEKLLFILTGNFGKKGCNTLHTFLVPLIGHSPDPSEGMPVTRTAVTGMMPISKIYPPNILPAEILSDNPSRLRALIVDSANPVISAAGTKAYLDAMKKLELLVVIDVALTETAQLADYVLPASSQFEKVEATFFTMGFPKNAFHLRAPILQPLPGTLPEPEIYRRICVAMGALPERFPLLEKVAKYGGTRALGPAIKALFSLRPKLASQAPLILYQTLGKALPQGMQSAAVLWASANFYAKRYPEAVRRAGIEGRNLGDALFEKILSEKSGLIFSEHKQEDAFSLIRHSNGKIQLEIQPLLEQLAELRVRTAIASEEYPYILIAGERRSYNANTIYRNPAWRKTDKDGFMRINPKDAAKLGVRDGQRVKLRSEAGSIQALAQHDDTLKPGVLSIPHGYGLEYQENGEPKSSGPRINELTWASHCDSLTKTPLHKNVPVQISLLAED